MCKLSLCKVKGKSKVVPVPRDEDVWVTEVTARRILNLNTR